MIIVAVHQLTHVRGAGGGRQRGTDAEQQSRQPQGLQAGCQQHRQCGEDGKAQGDEDQRSTANPVGEAAKQQQHRQHAQHISREGDRSGAGAVAGQFGVRRIQRCLQIDREGDQAQGKGQQGRVTLGGHGGLLDDGTTIRRSSGPHKAHPFGICD
ncbi:hypothetical protein D3C80_1587290 [compost metagenome]